MADLRDAAIIATNSFALFVRAFKSSASTFWQSDF
jgi:hypothetical protein